MDSKGCDIEDVIRTDSTIISWTAILKNRAKKGFVFNTERLESNVRTSTYRPFTKSNLFLDKYFNEVIGLTPSMFPTSKNINKVIFVSGIGSVKPFSAFIVDTPTSLDLQEKGQGFPLYWYEERKSVQGDLFDSGGEDRWIRHEAVTDFILERAWEQYGGKVQKEDIFYYVYGFLHCQSYRETFSNDLKKMLPRIPLVEKAEDFWAFCRAGRELADLHLHYEDVEPCPKVVVDMSPSVPQIVYHVEQMRFGKGVGKEKDRTVIVYNPYITLRNIPLRAYDYVINGKSGIRNDANQWGIEHDNPRYPLDLLQSVITLSLRTLDIVDNLPKVTF